MGYLEMTSIGADLPENLFEEERQMKYLKHFSTRRTRQSRPIPGSAQVANNAGGFAWAVDDWARLDRFLVLGSEGGTYYVRERELTVRNAEAVLRAVRADGVRVVNRVVEISEAGRAPKNDPALFVLAMCAGEGDVKTRQAALDALPRVARIGTHLFHFLEYAKAFRGWGRGLREAVAAWYNDKEADRLAYQVVKYRQRDGWTHRDVLRLAHPKPGTEAHNAIYRWVTQGETNGCKGTGAPKMIYAYGLAQAATTASAIIELIQAHGLTREMIPTGFLNDPDVWAALLERMPLMAMLRNLGNMSKVGLLTRGNWDAIDTVTSRLGDSERLNEARIHPLAVLAALNTYSQGKGVRGRGQWEPVAQVVDALDAAFYETFGNVEPVGKHVALALDVSGSMTWGNIAGVGGITPRTGSAAMALVTAATERRHTFLAFARQLVPITISPRQRLDDVCAQLDGMPFGGTDCAQPMLWALEQRVQDVDTFVIYTDSETWAGNVHPSQALEQYRRKYNPRAKLVVVGMVSNGFSIADPGDAGMLDVVGFDTATPRVIGDFATGRV
jgi:60 kDa SS-A/Ro ribonucleoprotein